MEFLGGDCSHPGMMGADAPNAKVDRFAVQSTTRKGKSGLLRGNRRVRPYRLKDGRYRK
jgi:hypothetical protein